jgi:hypothetical protein
MSTPEQMRAEFESYIKGSERWKGNTPLGTMTVNGAFHHYMDADTDTMWIGFSIGFRTHERLQENRAKLISVLTPT